MVDPGEQLSPCQGVQAKSADCFWQASMPEEMEDALPFAEMWRRTRRFAAQTGCAHAVDDPQTTTVDWLGEFLSYAQKMPHQSRLTRQGVRLSPLPEDCTALRAVGESHPR